MPPDRIFGARSGIIFQSWNTFVLAAWNNWNIDIPSFTLAAGIIFQLWNNLSTVRNIPDKKLFHCL
jgi:hypothetical protein